MGDRRIKTVVKVDAAAVASKILIRALELSCMEHAESSGTCPQDYFDVDPWEDERGPRCHEVCDQYTGNQMECWMKHFLNEARKGMIDG